MFLDLLLDTPQLYVTIGSCAWAEVRILCTWSPFLWCTMYSPPLASAAFPKLKSLGGFHPTMVGRVCVVIGAGPGLGISCAKRWVREGFKVPNMFVEPFLPYDFLEDNFIPRLL